MKIYHVDAFTDKAFRGNPAGVCVLDKERESSWMQQVAMEVNLSETAFLLKNIDYNLRWFTPQVEVDLCGHATLASAHILWTEGYVKASEDISFMTRSRELRACFNNNMIELDFPALLLHEEGIEVDLGLNPVFTGRTNSQCFMELEDEEEVRNYEPDYEGIKRLDRGALIITARAFNKDYDFVSRFFAPLKGVNEDPVTGAAHCCLAPYWKEKLGKDDLMGYQASRRGGYVGLSIKRDRVILKGKAVTIFRGELLI